MMIIKRPLQYATVIDRQGDCGVFDTMDDAIKLAYASAEEYSNIANTKKKDIVNAVINVLEDHLEELSSMTSKEIGQSSYDDILHINTIILNSCKNAEYFDTKANTCENSMIVNGVVVESPNPIETIIRNSILILKAGNSVVFSSSKNTKHIFSYTIKLINKAIEAVNGPKNLVVTVKEPSSENTNIMLEHEKVTLISSIDNHTIEKVAL